MLSLSSAISGGESKPGACLIGAFGEHEDSNSVRSLCTSIAQPCWMCSCVCVWWETTNSRHWHFSRNFLCSCSLIALGINGTFRNHNFKFTRNETNFILCLTLDFNISIFPLCLVFRSAFSCFISSSVSFNAWPKQKCFFENREKHFHWAHTSVATTKKKKSRTIFDNCSYNRCAMCKGSESLLFLVIHLFLIHTNASLSCGL